MSNLDRKTRARIARIQVIAFRAKAMYHRMLTKAFEMEGDQRSAFNNRGDSMRASNNADWLMNESRAIEAASDD